MTDGTAPAAVRVRGLTKRYGERLALDSVELSIERGEIRGLLGPNGAGKTTLLRALFGLVRCDAGSIELLGSRLQPGRPAEVRGVAGFVEEPAFYPYLSGEENLRLLGGLDGVEAVDTLAALERVGLGHRAHDRVGGYSTGMRQRLGLAAALLRDPEVLLLDEPSSGLDPSGVRSLSQLLRELAGQGVAVLLSSHLIGDLEALCDSYTIIRAGQVVWDGRASAAIAQSPAAVYTLASSDDAGALRTAADLPGVEARQNGSGGLRVDAAPAALDAYVCELGRRGVAIRRLDEVQSPLTTLFFERTGEPPAADEAALPDAEAARLDRPSVSGHKRHGGPAGGAPRASAGRASAVARAELAKLSAQVPPRALALLCLLGPLIFAVLLRAQSGTPSDALFGVWVHSSGFAVSLVVLSFAANWGFPIIAGVLGGDSFASEDRHGTWKTILTRSQALGDVFAGKVLAAGVVTVGLGALVAVSSILSALVVSGFHPLVDFGGRELAPAHLAGLVAVSWLIALAPALAYTCLAVLFSVASRNGIVGVLAPLIVALVTQLLALVGNGVIVHLLLIGSAFDAWHGLFAARPFVGPLLVSLGVCAVWIAGSLWWAWVLLRRREFAAASAPRSRRSGWRAPARMVAAGAALTALLALASNLGPVGVTSSRLAGALGSEFHRLALLQQDLLGHPVPASAHYHIVPACGRRGTSSQGPGDWDCTMHVYILLAGGAQPLTDTPVGYDVSVQSNGCYKAQSPPAFVGAARIRDTRGRLVVNPLETIYGCFDVL